MTTSKTAIILLSVGLGFATLFGGYQMFKNSSLSSKNQELAAEVGNLNLLKTDLLNDLEKMQSDYDELMASNNDLQDSFAETIAEMDRKDAEIKRIKSSNLGDSAEVQRLRKLKTEYAYVLNKLRLHTIVLEDANSELQNQNADLLDRVKDMKNQNEKLATRVFDLQQSGNRHHTATAFSESMTIKGEEEITIPQENSMTEKSAPVGPFASAENFVFDFRKKGDKPTGSHKRAKKMSVRFDVKSFKNTPEGKHKLYLVIRDVNGLPVEVSNPIMTTVNGNEQIIAQQEMTAYLNRNEQLKFEIMPKRKTLHEGYYRASVYTEKGLLGSEEFYLR